MDTPKAMTITIENAEAPGVRELLELSDDFHNELYPPEGVFLLDVSELLEPGVTVAVAREGSQAVGMAALVEKDGYAELKRMFVRPEARGSGTAQGLFELLEQVAREHGVASIKLETGPLQPAAIAFYTRNGFEPIELFGDYVGSEHSLCFAKTLS